MRIRAWALSCAVVLVLAGCGSKGEEGSLPEANLTTVAQLVLTYAKTTADFVELPAEMESLEPLRCSSRDGKGTERGFSVRGGFHLVSHERKATELANKLHDHWQAAGWTFKQFESANSGDSVDMKVVATDPSTGTQVWFTTSGDLSVHMSVYSACYHSAVEVDFDDPGPILPYPSASAS